MLVRESAVIFPGSGGSRAIRLRRDRHIELDFIVVLCQRVAHVSLELRNREVQFKLAILSTYERLEDGIRETANEATLVVLDYLVVVVLEELDFEVGQVETAVVVCRELVRDVENDLIRVALRHKRVRHRAAYLEDLVVR